MPTTDISIPDFKFSGFYYPEILEDLIQFKRQYVPELTDEDPNEPFIQLLRAFALTGHLNNVLLDLVARERFLPTAQLRASIRNHLALIGVKLAQATPAQTDVLYRLTRLFTAAATTVPAGSLFSTEGDTDAAAIEFEAQAAAAITLRTDLVGKVFSFNETGDVFSDHTTAAQTPSSWSPGWGTAENGDALYIGHPDVMFDRIDIVVVTAAVGITAGAWEFFDGDFDDGAPTSVTNLGATLEFVLTSILGPLNRSGSVVRVRSNITGAFEDLVSTFSGGLNKIVTTGFLGQTVPSTAAADYTVGTGWDQLTGLVDETALFVAAPATRKVTFTLPQSQTQNWVKTTVNSFEAFWIRFRITTVSSPSNPTLQSVNIASGNQHQIVTVSQGRSRTEDPLASSTGLPDQLYTLANFPVIDDDNLRVFVDEPPEQEYIRVENFLNSTSSDRHFTVAFDDDGRAAITFGDGTNGKIPPSGVDNIRVTYRTMVEEDGNVGAATIVVNAGSISYIDRVTNPRAATGFVEREGLTEESLALLKISGPAEIRVLGRAVTPDDVEVLSVKFIDADGSKPVKRAKAFEEAFGPKTIESVVVGAGGASLTSTQLDALEEYFNGSVAKKIKGILVMNNELTATNYTPKAINVTATVYGGTLAEALTALQGLLQPLAVEEDGVTFAFDYGGEVAMSKIISTLQQTTGTRKVAMTVPAADVALGARELPVPGTFTITAAP